VAVRQSLSSVARKVCVIAFAALTSFLFTVLCQKVNAESAVETTPPREIVEFEFTIKLPQAPDSIAWSADKKYIAVSEFFTGNVRLVDVEHHQVTDKIVAVGSGGSIMAWNPDNNLLALANAHQLRLISRNGVEISSIANPVGTCGVSEIQRTPSISFSPDGSFVWAGCRVANAKTSFVCAIKLSVPTLEVVGNRECDVPERGKRTDVFSYRLRHSGASVEMSSIVLSFDDTPASPKEIRTYVNVQDLSGGVQVFPTTRIVYPNAGPLTFPSNLTIGGNKLAAIWQTPSRNNPRIEILDMRHQDNTIFLGNEPELGGAEATALYFVSDNRLLVGTLHNSSKPGGIAVWDAQSGKLIQRVETASVFLSELSSDGNLIATTVGSDLNFYKIIQ
jgi:WD40 repeat protein